MRSEAAPGRECFPLPQRNDTKNPKKCGKNPPAYGYAVCERCLELCRSALDKTPTHNGKSLDTGFARALRAYYLLNKKEKK